MSENLRRSARLAGKQIEEIVLEPPAGLKYLKGQGLVLKSDPFYRLAVTSQDVPADAQSFLANLLEESGNELKFVLSGQITVDAQDVLETLNIRKEAKCFKITQKQLFAINSLISSEDEEEESEAEIPVKRSHKELDKTPEKRPKLGKSGKKTFKIPKGLTQYKKGVFNPNVKETREVPLLDDPSDACNFEISLRINNLNFHRAAATKNDKLLKNLLESKYKISDFMEPWGPECSITCLDRALLSENENFIIAFFSEMFNRRMYKTRNPPNGLTYIDTGEVSIQAYGVRTRKVNMSRGGREGNNALMSNSTTRDHIHQCIDQNFIKTLIKRSVSEKMLKFLMTQYVDIESWLGMCIGEAVRTGNKELSLFLISYFNKKGGFGLNFLHEQVLLKGPLDPFKKPSITKKPIENYLIAPLHVACINEDPAHLSTLLGNCDEVTYPDQEGRKAVHYAAANKSSGCLSVLQSYGCNLNEPDKFKITPLMIAARYNRVEAASFLIQQHVPLHLKSKDGRAAVHFAAENGSVEVLKVLLEAGCKVDQPGTDRKTPLMFAAIEGHYDLVLEILNSGGKDTKKDKCRRSALIWAVKNGHSNVVSLLLARGAPFDEPDSSKNYPIHYAAAFGWLDCLKMLIQAGADVNVYNDWKIQPLLVAMLQGQNGCVSYLLENTSVDVNGKDEQGRTLVSRAVDVLNLDSFKQFEHLVTVKLADVNIFDLQGLNPLHHLCKKQKPVCYLSYVSQKEKDEWERQQVELLLQAAKILIDYGCQVNSCANDGTPPVMYAIQSKNVLLTELLIRNGADLTVCPSGGGVFHYLMSFEPETINLCDRLLDDPVLVENSLLSLDEQGFSPFLKFVEFYALNHDSRYSTLYSQIKNDMELELAKLIEEERKKAAEQAKLISTNLTVNNSNLLNPDQPTTGSLFPFNSPLLNQQTSIPSSIFSAPSQPSGSLLDQYLDQTPSLSNYLSPVRKTIDHSELSRRTSEKHESEKEAFLHILQKMISKGADPHGVVEKLRNFRENPLTYELVANYFTDFDGVRRLKEYGPKGLFNALHLISACKDQKIFEFLLSLKISIFQSDYSRNSLLINYYLAGSSFTSELIDLGAVLDTQNSSGETFLQKVIERQDMAMAEKVLKLGASLKLKVSAGKTVLNIAVEKKNLKLVRLLLDYGADPNLPDDKGLTALHMAFNLAESTADASFDMESLLLLFKADINSVDQKGRTPLHYSFIKLGRLTETSHIDPIEAVSSACSLKKVDVNVPDLFRRTPLHYAAQRGAITSTMFMLSKGADLEIADFQGNTPLAIAIKSGHANYAVMLVQQSADVNKNVYVLRDLENTTESSEYSAYVVSSSYGFGSYNHYSGYNQQGRLAYGTYSTFKAAIIQGWQGLAYLLIFNGHPYMLAMQDAMSQGKFVLVKTLLAKVSDNSDLQKANDQGQNLFHTLAQYGRQADYEVTNLICEQLIDRGVDLHLKDSQGRSPLHYAVMNDYMVFARILLNNNVSCNDLDSCNLSPVGYAVNGGKISSCLQFLHLFAPFGANFQFRFNERGVTLTPILHAIKSKAPREVIKFLLEHGSSLQEIDSLGQNAFIYAVLNKDLPLVKALIYEGTLDLAQADLQGKTAMMYAVLNNDFPIVSAIAESSTKGIDQADSEGKHVLHHVVQPFPYGSFENAKMLELLLPLHPDPFKEDNSGNSILGLAQKQRSGVLLNVIKTFLKHQKVHPGPVMEIERKMSVFEENDFSYDYLNDADEYVKLQAQIAESYQVERKPDSNGDFPDYYKVLDDFDLLMTKVDLGFGPYSAYVFYRMQLLHDTNRDVFVLYTRWGRIGEVGASQRTPFSDREEGVKEFCKIFKAKTLNEWGQAFEKKRGKYQPMKLSTTRPKYKDFITEFQPELHPPTDLQSSILTAVKDFTSQNMFKSYFRTNSIDVNILNFSNMSRETLFTAEKILYELLNVVKDFQAETDIDKKLDLISRLQELSSRYYELIPIIHDHDSAIPPIMTEDDLKAHLEKISMLKDLEIASKVILAALYRERQVNPYEYILKSLQVNLEVLPFESNEFKLIQRYMKTASTSILSVLKVNRKGEAERIEQFKDVKNRKLLWHGTKSMNVISILQQGLKIAPPEAPSTGYMFGKGVYFADSFSKSLGYCSGSYSSTSFMLLCEVVLGNMNELAYAQYIEKLPEGFLSTKGIGYQQPDPNQSIFTPDGIEVPIGDLVHASGHAYGLSFNEFIVYNTAQIRMRYLLHLKYN